jgi:hypothetical protein
VPLRFESPEIEGAMDRARADTLIAELGAKLGLAAMALDETGNCSLSIDGGAVTVRISFREETGMFDFTTRLEHLTPKPAHLARALGLNFCWQANGGATFALDPLSGRLVLGRRCPATDLDLAGLNTVLEKLVGHALAWSKILGEMKEERAAVRPDAASARVPLGVRA